MSSTFKRAPKTIYWGETCAFFVIAFYGHKEGKIYFHMCQGRAYLYALYQAFFGLFQKNSSPKKLKLKEFSKKLKLKFQEKPQESSN